MRNHIFCGNGARKENSKYVYENNFRRLSPALRIHYYLELHGLHTVRVLNAVSSETAIIAKSNASMTASNTKPTSVDLTSSVVLAAASITVLSYDTQQSNMITFLIVEIIRTMLACNNAKATFGHKISNNRPVPGGGSERSDDPPGAKRST